MWRGEWERRKVGCSKGADVRRREEVWKSGGREEVESVRGGYRNWRREGE